MREKSRKLLRKLKLLGVIRKMRKFFDQVYIQVMFIIKQIKLRIIFNKRDRKVLFKKLHTVIYVNPNQVNYVTKDWPMDKIDNFFISSDDKKGLISSEEWKDNRRAHITETIRHLFVENKPYEESAQYKMMIQNLKRKKGYTYHCKSPSDVDKYFVNLYKSYKSIKDEGYKTQEELREQTPELIQTIDNHLRENDEIKAYIGQYGELILARGGTHRLLISKLLNIDTIPVMIVGVNISWLIKAYAHSEMEVSTSQFVHKLLKIY